MNTRTTGLLASTALILLLAVPAVAQSSLTGTDALDDRIDDIQENTADDFERSFDESRFGSRAFPEGISGSFSASANAADGNTDTVDVAVGGRLRFGAGRVNQSVGLALEYAEDDGDSTENNAFAVYDITYDLTPQVYVFGLGRAEYDEFSSFEVDAFLGAGPGYRIFNQPDLAWRVQAGPGLRYTKDQDGDIESELGAIASSRIHYAFTPTTFLTNDTDVLYSDANTQAINDLGLNFRVSEQLITRISYRSEWDSEPLSGFDEADNTLALSVVYSFN